MIQNRIQVLTNSLETLLNAQSYKISDLLTQKPSAAYNKGVYILLSSDTPESIIYVGRTKTKTILGRLEDHCRLSTPSDLRGMLKMHPSFPKDPRSYYIRWILIEGNINRAQFESFVIAILQPIFNRYI